MKFFIFLLLLCVALPAPAQTPKADSLRQLLHVQPRRDTTRLRRLQALARELSASDVPQAMQLSRQVLILARELGNITGEGQALLSLSNLYRRKANYDVARRCAQRALRLFARRADYKGQGKAWLQLSLIDKLQGNPVAALAGSLKGLPLAAQAGDVQTQMRLQANMGDIYSEMGNYDEALLVLQAALKNGQRIRDQQMVLSVLNGLGDTFQKLKKWPRALFYYQRALALSQQLGDAMGEVVSETGLAEAYGSQGNRVEALAHGLRARQLVQASHDDYSLPLVELMLARAYLLDKQIDSTMVLARHGLQLSQAVHNKENIRNASAILAQAYAQRGNFSEAYRYLNLHMAYNDTLSGEDTQRRTSALRYDYELERKQGQIDLLTKTRQLQAQKAARQRLQLYGLLAGLGGVVLVAGLLLRNIFLKQRTNRHLNDKNVEIAAHRDNLDRTLTELQAAQTQLVQREKMASLGELTAGVAHEIQNPLNFVTNFSDLSVELVAEIEVELAKESISTSGKHVLDQLLHDLAQNQNKIHEHGYRADRIVKRMLEHSRTNSGHRQATDLNALAEECLRLAFHGWRAKNKDFKATLTTDFDPHLERLEAVSQDISQVLINLLTNAFYAVSEKSKLAGDSYRPEVSVQTQQTESGVQIRVRDNGNGIPTALREKIFQPFFTTKPTGEGTGLGLSLSYDIITKGHGGAMSVESEEEQFTQFSVSLPISHAAVLL